MRILFTNDDGVHAAGLQSLHRRFRDKLECWVSAPHAQQSAQSHAFSLGKTLAIHRHSDRCVSVAGTPADSVYYGMHGLGIDGFDWVLSGINAGSNLGTDTHYSGTVGAAMEGCFHGAHALAISLHGVERNPNADYTYAADLAFRVHAMLAPLVQGKSPTCWNLNVPYLSPNDIKEVRAAPLAQRRYKSNVEYIKSDQGVTVGVRLGGAHEGFDGGALCDGPLLFSGHPTLTQLGWNWSAGPSACSEMFPLKTIQEYLSEMA